MHGASVLKTRFRSRPRLKTSSKNPVWQTYVPSDCPPYSCLPWPSDGEHQTDIRLRTVHQGVRKALPGGGEACSSLESKETTGWSTIRSRAVRWVPCDGPGQCILFHSGTPAVDVVVGLGCDNIRKRFGLDTSISPVPSAVSPRWAFDAIYDFQSTKYS